MKDKLQHIRKKAEEDINSLKEMGELKEIQVKYLGKKGL